MNLRNKHEIQKMLSAIQTALADPDYLKFVSMPIADAFACLPPDKVDRFIEVREYQSVLTPDRIAQMMTDLKNAEKERLREEEEKILSLLRLPASKETTQYFRANLDSPHFSRWRKSYAKMVEPKHVQFVDSVRKKRPEQGYDFFFDDSLGPVKRNYPKNRKMRGNAFENRKKMYDFVVANPHATDENIAIALGVKVPTVKKGLKWLRENGYLETMVWRKNSLVNANTSAYAWCNHRVFSPLKPLEDTL